MILRRASFKVRQLRVVIPEMLKRFLRKPFYLSLLNYKIMITIRKATKRDFQAAGHLMESMWELHGDETRLISKEQILSVPGADYIRELLEKSTSVVFVAETNGQIVGVVSCCMQDLPTFYKQQQEAYIDDLSVAEDFQRQGIASKLLQACEEFARANSVSLISAKVWKFNKASAALMEANGLESDFTYFHKQLS
jgi:aminoglycoside 3-N-acetyltransferase I